MNVYDSAHALARAMKESQEYKTYIKLKQEVNQIDGVREVLADFQAKQFEFQAMQLSGQAPDGSALEQMQGLYQAIARDPKAAEYLQAEMVFSRMVADVYAVLGEIIKVGDET